MTALAPQASAVAQVINLDDWRDPDRIFQRIPRILPRPKHIPCWDDLHWIAMTDKRDAIRIYAKLGLHPIVLHGVTGEGACTCGRGDCAAVGKHPVNPGWQKALFDLNALDNALLKNWRYNIGLRMGPQPGGFTLIAVDCDGPLSLLEPIEERESQKFPTTLTAKTARGFHLLYTVPTDLVVKNRAGIAPHVDVRGIGGQIVAPPSLHHTGHVYRWLDVRAPEALPS